MVLEASESGGTAIVPRRDFLVILFGLILIKLFGFFISEIFYRSFPSCKKLPIFFVFALHIVLYSRVFKKREYG